MNILHQLQRLFKRGDDEPPPVRERYPLDIEHALHAQYEAGRQSGLKEQAGLGGINVLEALHRKFQAGIQAGVRLGSRLRCSKGHYLGAMRELSPGVYVSTCAECSKQAHLQGADVERMTDKMQASYIPGQRSRQHHRSLQETQQVPTPRKYTTKRLG